MTIGQRIQQLRKERHWSRAELAKASHVSPHTIVSWEARGITPSRHSLKQVAAALQVPELSLIAIAAPSVAPGGCSPIVIPIQLVITARYESRDHPIMVQVKVS